MYQDGSPMAWALWWPDEPNNLQGFGDTPCNCVAYKRDFTSFTMTDKLCFDMEYRSICQKTCPGTSHVVQFTAFFLTLNPTVITTG